MTILDTGPQATRCAERVRRVSELAKLEFQRSLFRGRWYASVAALAKRGAHADKCLTRNVRRWAALVTVLEERIAKETALLERGQ